LIIFIILRDIIIFIVLLEIYVNFDQKRLIFLEIFLLFNLKYSYLLLTFNVFLNFILYIVDHRFYLYFIE